jgi:UDP-galactopyranose mutase
MAVKKILIVGAGFAGATYARTLADSGHFIDVIDKRDHVAGNAFDYVDPNGIRVHRYGPHLFHTNNEAVVNWLKIWGDWVPYEHRVRALLPNGITAPLPINRVTLETVFGVRLADAAAAEAFLAGQAESRPRVANAADYLGSKIGRQLTDLFFRPYTKKMWGLDLEDLDASVVQRIPLRYDDESRYFPNDRFQLIPKYGYTAVFEEILDHPRTTVFERARIRLRYELPERADR